jgi:2-polyprenyl-3-methyl-5-hydroxy-6-metoxy-1,4-benzoquinol methylase
LHSRETNLIRMPNIEYFSQPAKVSMADEWFEVATLDHFWVRRRFEVFRRLAGSLIPSVRQIAEVGCGHGLLQRQIEDAYGREVTGFDLNEFALKQNVSRISKVCCYDIYQRDATFRHQFELIVLFDVLEHIAAEDGFFDALKFLLAPGGKVVVNVPAGQWAYSAYDEVAGHVRRYSIGTLREAALRNKLEVSDWSYWGLPLTPILALRKLWLAGNRSRQGIISTGFAPRTPAINAILGFISRCEPIPQKLLGTSLMAVLEETQVSR